MWTPHLKKWGSIDPLDPLAPRPLCVGCRHNMPLPPASGDLESHPDRLVTSTFDLLTLELVCNVISGSGTDNLPANFGATATFLCPVMGERAS